MITAMAMWGVSVKTYHCEEYEVDKLGWMKINNSDLIFPKVDSVRRRIFNFQSCLKSPILQFENFYPSNYPQVSDKTSSKSAEIRTHPHGSKTLILTPNNSNVPRLNIKIEVFGSDKIIFKDNPSTLTDFEAQVHIKTETKLRINFHEGCQGSFLGRIYDDNNLLESFITTASENMRQLTLTRSVACQNATLELHAMGTDSVVKRNISCLISPVEPLRKDTRVNTIAEITLANEMTEACAMKFLDAYLGPRLCKITEPVIKITLLFFLLCLFVSTIWKLTLKSLTSSCKPRNDK